MPGKFDGIVTIDFGSTKAVVRGPGVHEKVGYSWNEYGKKQDLSDFTCITPDNLLHVVRTVQDLVPPWAVLGITGLKHSAIVEFKNESTHAVLFGDDPSLSSPTGLSPRVNAAYQSEGEVIPSHSTVRKVDAFLHNQERLTGLLFSHKDIHPNSLHISALLSYMAEKISGEQLGIFPKEADDYKRQKIEMTGMTVPSIFNLQPHQLVFSSTETVTLNSHQEIWVVPDFQAEVEVLSKLRNEGGLPPGAWIFATDGVLKRLRDSHEDGVKTIEDFYYDTMRRMGNTAIKTILPLFSQKGIVNESKQMFAKFEAVMRNSTLPKDWFYDPRANNECGQLWHREGRCWIKTENTDLLQLEGDDFWQAVQAYGWGLGGAMYEGVPEGIHDVVIYGGLMCLFGGIQPGWGHVFIESAPTSAQVHWLQMTDAGMALELLVREQKGEKVDWRKEVPIQPLRKGGGVGVLWLDQKHDIEVHGRM